MPDRTTLDPDYPDRQLYVIGVPNTPIVKIGIARLPVSRLHHIRQGICTTIVPEQVDRAKLELLHHELGSRNLEAHLHKYFYQRRVAGEWFALGMVAVPMIRSVIRDHRRLTLRRAIGHLSMPEKI
jgi:hypothetical protein